VKIADNIVVLDLTDERGTYHPTLVWDEHEVVLIDTGLPGQLELISKAIAPLGFSLADITKVIITHQDHDHIGCVNELRHLGAQILAHKDEVPYLEGLKTPVRLSELEEDLKSRSESLNDGERDYYEQVKSNAPLFYTSVDRELDDGEVLDCCGGIKVVHTPGHMPGHIVLHLLGENIIVAGDAANVLVGEFVGPNPVFTSKARMPQAQESFTKMMALEPRLVVCFHGGVHEVV